MKKTTQIISCNKHTKLHVVFWEPEGEIRAVLQISHGMKEYAERYEELATYLCYRGILVVGHDHIGHGKSVDSLDERGYFRLAAGKNGAETAVTDMHRVNGLVRKQYPDVPFFFLGHSMGSFFVRQYLSEYEEKIDGVILSGTTWMPAAGIKGGYALLKLMELKCGDKYKSDWLGELFNRVNNAKIPNPRTQYDWLTTDVKKTDEYLRDQNCNYFFSVNGYRTLLNSLEAIQKKENIEKIPKDIPILYLSGSEDPIGNYGKGVKEVYRRYKKAGLKRMKLCLYEGSRHEPINEIDRFSVFGEIYCWIKKRV